MADLRIVDAPEIPTENITGEEKLPTGGSGNYSISLDSLADYTKTKKDLADNTSVDGKVNGVRQELNTHIEDLLNPHQVTKGQIGLGNVDNTADADKPVSNSTQASIISAVTPKADKSYVDNQLTLKANEADVYTKVETYTKQESSDLVNNSISTALTPVNSSLDLAKRGIVNRYDSALTYNSGERVILANGDIVKSTIDVNVNDPNVDMTGWSLDDNTVYSIAQLRTIDPQRKGIRLYLNSVIAGKDLGGGMFVSTQKVGLVDNGGTIIASPDPALFWVRINYDNVIPQFWGALGDADNDDRPAFQSAVNYLHSIGGGELLVPKPVSGYRWKSYDSVESACLVIHAPLGGMYSDPITVRGAGNIIEIRVDLGLGVLIDAAIKLKGSGLYKKFENLSVWGGLSHIDKNCKRVLDGWEGWHPNLTIRDCRFYSATEDCVRLATYVSVLDKVQTAYSPIGTKLEAPSAVDAPITSITMNSCYGLNHTRHALWVGQLTYSTINSHAADHIINDANDGYEAYPYYIDIARGVTINGLGAESSTRILKVRSAQGLTINGIMTLSIGDNANPPEHLIRIDGGSSTVIGGVHLQNPKAYTKILSLGSTFASESVTILDDSIAPDGVSYVTHWGSERPIFFVTRQLSRKTQTITLTNTGNATTNTTNFNNAVKNAFNLELLHDVIVRFPSGDFPINGFVHMSNHLTRGSGRIRLIGNADNTSRIVITGNGSISFGGSSIFQDLTYQVENLNLHIGAVTASYKGLSFYKGTTNFINSKITSDNSYKQYYAESSPTIRLDSNSSIQTNYYGTHTVEFTYKATTAPSTSSRLPAGTIFMASNPNATRIGWINTTDNGATWLAITP